MLQILVLDDPIFKSSFNHYAALNFLMALSSLDSVHPLD